ncbi:MAG: tetratricopeptide repeat protein [Phototrophicaceae bacterium]
MTETKAKTPQRQPIFAEGLYESLVALVIIIIAIYAALLDYQVEVASDNRDDTAVDMQFLAIDAGSLQTMGQIRSDFAWTQAYRYWLELDTLAALAYNRFDDPATARYDAVREEVTAISPLLNETYFPPELLDPDIRAYEADTYLVDVVRLREQFEDLAIQRAFWSQTVNAYQAQQSILTTALVLLGISITLVKNPRMQLFFTVVASAGIIVSVFWTVLTWQAQSPVRSEVAMEAYAQAVGLEWQLRYDEAVTAYTEAISAQPDYSSAYIRRGFVYREQEDFANAIPDFEAAVRAERTEVATLGQLGELYYLTGRLEDASAVARTGIEANNDPIHYFDLGRNELVQGNISEARVAYAQGVARVEAIVSEARANGQEPSPLLYRSVDIAFLELDDLLACINGGDCSQAAPLETITVSNEVKSALLENSKLLKELNVAQEFSVSAAPPEVSFSPITQSAVYSDDTTDSDGEYIVDGTFNVNLTSTFSAVPQGTQFLVKVFIGDDEFPALRQIETWERGEAGEITVPLTFRPGQDFDEYGIQLYIDAKLVGETTFFLTDFPPEPEDAAAEEVTTEDAATTEEATTEDTAAAEEVATEESAGNGNG